MRRKPPHTPPRGREHAALPADLRAELAALQGETRRRRWVDLLPLSSAGVLSVWSGLATGRWEAVAFGGLCFAGLLWSWRRYQELMARQEELEREIEYGDTERREG